MVARTELSQARSNTSRRFSIQKFIASVETTQSASDEVNFGNDSSLVLTGDFTIAVWLRGYDLWQTSNSHGIFGKRTDASNREFTCFYQGSNNTIVFKVANTSGTAETPLTTAGNELLDNKWYRLVVTRSGNDFTLYLDGSSVDTGTSSIVIGDTSANVTLGAWATDGGFNWNGQLTHFYINSGYAWSSDDVANDYYDGTKPSSGTAVLDARMTDGTGSTVTDSSASSNDGTLEGSATWSLKIPKTERFVPTPILNSLQTFGNSGDYVGWDNTLMPFSLSGYSISIWFKIRTETYNDNNNVLLTMSSIGGNTLWELAQWQSGGTKFVIFARDKNATTFLASEFTTRNLELGWHHIIYADDGAGNGAIYIDGVLDKSFTYTPPTAENTNNFARTILGSLSYVSTFSWDGYLTGFKVWDKQLSAAEARRVYLANSNEGATNVYDMIDGSGSTLTDSVGSFDGTIAGNIAWSDDKPYTTRTDI